MWGGKTKNFEKNLRFTLHRFNPVQESWTEQQCNGAPPSGLYYGACTSSGHYLYIYGGINGEDRQCSLHLLNLKSVTWKQLSSVGPSKKVACEMVTYKNKLIVFGGYGVPSSFNQPSQWDGKFTNELHTFDLKEGVQPIII